jgi:hypothetical protein
MASTAQTTELALTLRLSDRARARLAEQAAQQGQDISAVASDLIEEAVTHPDPADMPYEQWVAAFKAWIGSHKAVGHYVDDSRESIYEGRGE